MPEEGMNTNKYKPGNDWEEAGGEFYQEILPSKQSRCGTSTKRRRRQSGVQDFKIKYWQQSTQKPKNDVQFAKLPDLSEVHTNEELIWEEILQIKLMPIKMQQKKMLKITLNSATKLRLIGFNQFKWKQRKFYKRFGLKWSEWTKNFELWRFSLNQVEGCFGSGVVSYFLFLRWLFFLNAFTFIVILIFIILPQIMNQKWEPLTNTEDKHSTAENSFEIAELLEPSTSPLFYGSYLNKKAVFYSDRQSLNLTDSYMTYDLSVAYVSVNSICICITFILLTYAASCEFKQRLKNGKWQLCQYCNLIFCGWDYCTHYFKFTTIKHNAAFIALKQLIQTKRVNRSKKSRNYILKRQITRIIINVIVFLILVLSSCSLYVLFNIRPINQMFFNDTTTKMANNSTGSIAKEFPILRIQNSKQYSILFLMELVPYYLLVLSNMTLSALFNYFCKLERYSSSISIKITLLRHMLLRLMSISTVLYYITFNVVPQLQELNVCWENYISQQLYNFVIAEFTMQLLITFGINFPLSLCTRRLKFFAQTLHMFDFDLLKHMLDIIYLQAICWLGTIYCPGFPLLVSLILFCKFYVQKFQCLINSTLSSIFFPRSHCIAMYTFTLLFAYIMSLTAILFAIMKMRPSLSCGLFRERAYIWEAVIVSYSHLPNFIKYTLIFFTTKHFIIICFFILILLLYYYHTVADANKNLVDVLRNQLVLEGHDKQFLLNRLSVFLKQYQEKSEV